MCSPATCSNCQKVTYSGCGMHAAQILSRFPADQRCECR